MSEIWNAVNEIYVAVHSGNLPDLGVWSYVLLAVLVATEGPLSTLLGAAAAAAGMAELRWVLLATILGNIIGDCVWYSVGYQGKSDTLKRYGRYIGIKAAHVDRLESGMQSHAVKLILLSKVAYGLIVPTLVAAGVARVPFRKWFPIVFVMETLWSLVLVYVGYHATWLLVDFERGLRTVGVVVLVALIAGVGLLIYRKRRGAIAIVQAAEATLKEPARGIPVPMAFTAPSIRIEPLPLRNTLPCLKNSVIDSIAPMPLMGESISVRFAEAFQVWESVSVLPTTRLEAEPVEGRG